MTIHGEILFVLGVFYPRGKQLDCGIGCEKGNSVFQLNILRPTNKKKCTFSVIYRYFLNPRLIEKRTQCFLTTSKKEVLYLICIYNVCGAIIQPQVD